MNDEQMKDKTWWQWLCRIGNSAVSKRISDNLAAMPSEYTDCKRAQFAKPGIDNRKAEVETAKLEVDVRKVKAEAESIEIDNEMKRYAFEKMKKLSAENAEDIKALPSETLSRLLISMDKQANEI